jgi:membrane-associated phospholipid phosphatase
VTLRRIAILGATFVALTVLVGTTITDAFDAWVLGLILPLRTPLVDNAFQLVTLVGGPLVSSVLAIALTFLLVTREGRRGQVALLMFVGIAIEAVLKQVVFQPGPPSELTRDSMLLVSLRDLSPYTYPSGYAMRVAFLGALVAVRYPRLRVPIGAVVALVAFGRVYLAAGWAADVAGGLLAGFALAALAKLIADRVGQSRPATPDALVSP